MQTQNIVDHIVTWLINYVENAGLQGFTIGVSGGIDSAVTSTLCARTGKKVLAVTMPILQAEDQVSRSCEHIDWLRKNHDNVLGIDMELTPVFKQIQTSFPGEIQDNLTMANTRARLRMLTLYSFASHHRMLVVGTGNKVEDFGVGFYTKYGDGGVDISPIADLMKSQVYVIGQWLGISQDILSAAPTDGLWEEDRSDESRIGATYGELEWAMGHELSHSSGNIAIEKNLDARKKKVLNIFRKLNAIGKHKMEPIPVCRIPKELFTV